MTRIDSVNLVLAAIENCPFTLASLSMISYRSSPSNVPLKRTLSTTADANGVVCEIFLPIRSVTVPDNTLTFRE